MTEDHNYHSQPPDQDQALDQLLTSLARFAPGPGFEDRVMARVRLPASRAAATPTPAVRLPARRRWPVLAGSLAGVAAASSTALTAWVALHFGAVAALTATSVATLTVPIWHAALTWLAGTSASAGGALLAAVLTTGKGPLIWATAALNLAVPVSLIGLVIAARPYLRKTDHAVR